MYTFITLKTTCIIPISVSYMLNLCYDIIIINPVRVYNKVSIKKNNVKLLPLYYYKSCKGVQQSINKKKTMLNCCHCIIINIGMVY